MNRRSRTLALAAALLAAAWSQDGAGDSRQMDGFVVHYDAFDATSRGAPRMAPGVELRDEFADGVVVIALRRRNSKGALESIGARLEGSVSDILGRRHVLSFEEVRSNDLVSYVAAFDAADLRVGAPVASFRIEVTPDPPHAPFVLEFEERLAPAGSRARRSPPGRAAQGSPGAPAHGHPPSDAGARHGA